MFDPVLLADGLGSLPWLGAGVAIVAVLFFSFALMLTSRYKRCPSNRVLVIFGKVGGGNTARCIHGGAAFVMLVSRTCVSTAATWSSDRGSST